MKGGGMNSSKEDSNNGKLVRTYTSIGGRCQARGQRGSGQRQEQEEQPEEGAAVFFLLLQQQPVTVGTSFMCV
jgi:hypothetical protein